MREIKFKCWNINKKEWVLGSPLALEVISFCDNPFKCVNIPAKQQGLVFLQYTGLKDKNEEEIYEGDILSVDNNKRTCEVVWFKPAACFDAKPLKIIDKFEAFRGLTNTNWEFRCEIIGNIYENPELIEKL